MQPAPEVDAHELPIITIDQEIVAELKVPTFDRIRLVWGRILTFEPRAVHNFERTVKQLCDSRNSVFRQAVRGDGLVRQVFAWAQQ